MDYYDKKEINSPLRYAGGKFYARKLILQAMKPHDSYIEPFSGGASIFFAKPKVAFNWLNDIDEELVNCFLTIRDNCEGLIAFLDGLPATKDLHTFYKKEFKAKNNLERAGRWYYLNRTSYSGIMKMQNCYWGYGDKYSMRPENWPGHLRKCSSKLQGVRITSLDYAEVINSSPVGSFLFIDPPYYGADQDKFYTHSFLKDDHLRLSRLLHENRDRIDFLVTYDNSSELRELYGWAGVEEKEWNYTINRTDDQTKVTNKKGSRYKGKEVFITNYMQTDITSLNQRLFVEG